MMTRTIMKVAEMAGLDPELVVGSLASTFLEKGREAGRRECEPGPDAGLPEARRWVLRLLGKRFGPLPAWVQERVATSSMDALGELSEKMLEASSLDDVFG
jgi:hypothetical protein